MAQQSPPASSNLNGDNAPLRPDSVDVAEAVALMDDLGEAPEDEAEETASAGEGEGDDSETEGGGEGDEAAEDAADEEAEASAEDAEPPEFWSAEDKAAWNAVPPELRPVLKKYEQQRVEFANEKARDAAQARAQATQDVERANAVIAQAAQWWQQTGPALQRAFANKWAQVDWKTLAEKDSAEYARLDQERQKEAALLADANRRQQEDTKIATERAAQAFELAKLAENAKLAHRLPDYFGSPERAQKTYAELGKFLFAKGIPADRIAQIHEAPIIEMALAAMRFEQAQQHVLRSSEGKALSAKAGKTQGKPTPTRVNPGPASPAPSQARAGNRNADAARQVGERFRKNGGNSIADAAELNNPQVAMTALLHKLCLDTFQHSASGACLEASVRHVFFPVQAADLKDSPSAKAVADRHEVWKADLPTDEAALWDWLVALDDASRVALLAHCISLGINALYEKGDRYGGPGVSVQGVQHRIARADRLARAVGLDMVEAGWRPTVDNYLGRVTKPRILEAVREAKGEQAAQLIDHLKKAEMAKEAERLLDGSGWLPEPLRLADSVAASVAPTVAVGELPAFLAEGEGQDAAAHEQPSHPIAAE